MKNNIRLHWGQSVSVSAKSVGQAEDSGNGYYSYSYYLLPYTGTLTPEAKAAVQSHLHNKHYHYPFTSLSCVKEFGALNLAGDGGILLVGTTYHHGD